jgi:hypothetical protein
VQSPISNLQSPAPRRLSAVFGWTRTSYFMFSGFVLLLFVMGYVWWPLAEEYLALIDWQGQWWRQLDWLLIGIFAFMSLLIMSHADIKADLPIILVGLIGGLVIESWGTQTELWTYYTQERPPLWIIPAWPIASLSIDRLVRLIGYLEKRILHSRELVGTQGTQGNSRNPSRASRMTFHVSRFTHHVSRFTLLTPRSTPYALPYWLTFTIFYLLLLQFAWPTLDKSFTWLALALCALLILTPTDHRLAFLTFAAGSGLGYFLERWGTTRLCWTYYTLETPPLFAVLAHGMAAVAFWRALLLLKRVVCWLSHRPSIWNAPLPD